MRRFLLLLACLLGSAVGAVLGVIAGVTVDSALLAWASAAVYPVLALMLAGIRQRGQLAKIAGYALLGWGLCFVLEPAMQQTAAHRALRIAADPLVGKGWYIPCHITSWVLASVGVTFLPSQPRKKCAREAAEASVNEGWVTHAGRVTRAVRQEWGRGQDADCKPMRHLSRSVRDCHGRCTEPDVPCSDWRTSAVRGSLRSVPNCCCCGGNGLRRGANKDDSLSDDSRRFHYRTGTDLDGCGSVGRQLGCHGLDAVRDGCCDSTVCRRRCGRAPSDCPPLDGSGWRRNDRRVTETQRAGVPGRYDLSDRVFVAAQLELAEILGDVVRVGPGLPLPDLSNRVLGSSRTGTRRCRPSWPGGAGRRPARGS